MFFFLLLNREGPVRHLPSSIFVETSAIWPRAIYRATGDRCGKKWSCSPSLVDSASTVSKGRARNLFFEKCSNLGKCFVML